MNSLFNNMKLAHKQMRGNPVAFTDAIAGAVGKAERGAHRHKWQAIAMCVGIARQVRKNFAQFEELRGAPCLQGNKKVQKATEKNFKKFVPIAVATRSFYNTEATENRISVYGYGIGYFVGKKIPLARIPDRIKAKKGIDGVYALVKDKKREARDLQDGSETTSSSATENGASEPDKRASAASEASAAPSKREVAAGERLTVEWILENHLLIKMPKEEKERFLDGSARRGQRRQLDTAYSGRGAHNLYNWEYVYSRDIDAGTPSHEDNDNEPDYEGEDAAQRY